MGRTDVAPGWVYRYPDGVELTSTGDSGFSLSTASSSVAFESLRPTQAAILRRLADGVRADELESIAAADDRMWARMTIAQLLAAQLLERTLVEAGQVVATAEIVGVDYRPNERVPAADAVLRLSRFAVVHQQDGVFLLESPLSRVRFVLTDPRSMVVLAVLGHGRVLSGIGWPDDITPATGVLFARALFQEGFLEDATTGVTSIAGMDEDAHAALGEWAFHDLLFHARTRLGRHRLAYGGTYPQYGRREPLPAVKDPGPGEIVELAVPDLDRLRRTDPAFADVVETRRSWRMPGPDPLTRDQLGEFLFRTARVRERFRGTREEVTSRPYPGGGADYELEIYLAAYRVADLPRGLYRYDPGQHGLEKIAPWTPLVGRIAEQTARKAPPGQTADVTLLVTARLLRLTYKYESIAYAVALKDLGVLYHGFYLAATAMGLAPCAVGGGDSDAFAAATGISALTEPQIGEFLLSSRNREEVQANDRLKTDRQHRNGPPTEIATPLT
ncbi:MAG: SagB family peptide dehydrogenase [Actinomycetes bacterium]